MEQFYESASRDQGEISIWTDSKADLSGNHSSESFKRKSTGSLICYRTGMNAFLEVNFAICYRTGINRLFIVHNRAILPERE